jgi:hypothetical protein
MTALEERGAAVDATASIPPQPIPKKRAWSAPVVTFLLVFACLLCWSLAVPVFASPDENAHAVRSYSIVRGDAAGREDPVAGTYLYEVPVVLRTNPACFAFKSTQHAGCMVVEAGSETAAVASSAHAYPPLYHVAVGLPTFLAGSDRPVIAMRVWQSAIVAALIALAVHSLRGVARRGAMPFVGVVLTPMVFFLGATVNPSGVAAAAGLAAWAGLLALLLRPTNPTAASAAAAFGPLCVLLLLRRDGVYWSALIAIVLLVLLQRENFLRLIRSRAVVGWSLVAGLCAALQYTVWAGPGSAEFADGATTSGSWRSGFGAVFTYFWQQIGVLGWLDTWLPSVTYYLWFAALGTVLLAGLAFAPRRLAIALAVGVALAVIAPTLIGSIRYPYFQGRYSLPFVIGLPLLAGVGILRAVGSSPVPWRPLVLVDAVIVVCSVAGFAQHLRRYVVGSSGPWSFLYDGGSWKPPVPPLVLLCAWTIAHVALLAWLASIDRKREQDPVAVA